jgi:hypothetical protein
MDMEFLEAALNASVFATYLLPFGINLYIYYSPNPPATDNFLLIQAPEKSIGVEFSAVVSIHL